MKNTMNFRAKPKHFQNHVFAGRIVVGLHSAREVLKVRPKKIKEIWLQIGAEKQNDLKDFVDFAKRENIKLRMQPDGQMNKVAGSHQGVVLYVDGGPEFDRSLVEDRRGDEKITLLALDQVTDPHNIGAALRT